MQVLKPPASFLTQVRWHQLDRSKTKMDLVKEVCHKEEQWQKQCCRLLSMRRCAHHCFPFGSFWKRAFTVHVFSSENHRSARPGSPRPEGLHELEPCGGILGVSVPFLVCLRVFLTLSSLSRVHYAFSRVQTVCKSLQILQRDPKMHVGDLQGQA